MSRTRSQSVGLSTPFSSKRSGEELEEPPLAKRAQLEHSSAPCHIGVGLLECSSGLVFEYLAKDEAVFLYQEIFQDRTYFQHGIQICDDSTVLDVGANIGLFSLCCAREAKRVRVLAFEPISSTFKVLRRNLAHLPMVQIRQEALGSKAIKNVPFSTFAEAPGECTRWPGERQGQRSKLLAAAQESDWARRVFQEQPHVAVGLGAAETTGATKATKATEATVTSEASAEATVARVESVESVERCSVTTLSSVLRREQVDAIDLLKVDVEGDELEVRAGVGVWGGVRGEWER